MSVATLIEHRAIWAAKPVLAVVYEVWFELLLASIPEGGRVIEVGAGPGFLSAYARRRRPDLRWWATDISATDWNDCVGDALKLPFRSGCADAVAVFDVIHHLARPASFFAEAARVLRPRGAIVAVEPWVSPLSLPIYRLFHQEGCSFDLDPWQPFHGDGKDPFEGDAAVVRRLVQGATATTWRDLGLARPEIRLLNGFAYLLSLGFRRASLLPLLLAPTLQAVDRRLAPLARWLSFRALAVWPRV